MVLVALMVHAAKMSSGTPLAATFWRNTLAALAVSLKLFSLPVKALRNRSAYQLSSCSKYLWIPVLVSTDCWLTVEATSNAVRGFPCGCATCGLNCARLDCSSMSMVLDTLMAASIDEPIWLKFIGSKFDFQIVNGPM